MAVVNPHAFRLTLSALLVFPGIATATLPSFDAAAPLAKATATVGADPPAGIERRVVTLALPADQPTGFRSVVDPRAMASAFLAASTTTGAYAVPGANAMEALDSQTTSAAIHVERFKPMRDGIEIFRETVNVLLDAAGNVRAVSGVFSGRGEQLAAPAGQRGYVIDSAEAVAIALEAYGLDRQRSVDRLAVRDEVATYTRYTLPAEAGIRVDRLRAKQVWFRLPLGLVPAWYVETGVQRAGQRRGEHFAHVIAADDGRLLFRHDQVADAAYTYTAFVESGDILLPLPGPGRRGDIPHPAGTNNGYVTPLLPPQTVTLDHAPLDSVFPGAPAFSDPWLPAGASVTTGNNVEAFINNVEPDDFNPGDIRPQVTAAGVFGHSFDVTQQPDASIGQRMAAGVHLFYVTNYLHDWFYRAGFTEASGNAQASNYGRGGIEGDSMKAQGQDYSGLDNANMLTPADGERPRMRMYLATPAAGTSLVRDGTLDTGVIAHEFGHYINNRLIGDASGLNNQIGHAMSEGWGDFHALLMLVKAEDAAVPANAGFNGTYASGSYTAAGGFPANNQNQSYFGIRRYPYSTDMTRNPLTLRHISDGEPLPVGPPRNTLFIAPQNSAFHNAGEVWGNMVWECYAGLLRDTLGATPRHGFSEARRKMTEYLVAGYKLTPPTPTLIEARDAMLSVIAASNVQDFAVCAAGFAKRGAGLRAQSPPRYSSNLVGVVESYASGGDLATQSIELVNDSSCDADGILDPGEVATLRVRVLNPGTAAVSGGSVTVVANSAAIGFPQGNTVALPTLLPYREATVDLRVSLAASTPRLAVTFTATPAASGLAFPSATPGSATVRVNANEQPSSSDAFEASLFSWTAQLDSGFNPAYSAWQRVPLDGGLAAHAINAPALGLTWMVSPVLQVGAGNFGFTFRESHQFEGDQSFAVDGGVVELSTNGGASWSPLPAATIVPGYDGIITACCDNPLGGRAAFTGTSAAYPALVPQTVNLGTGYAGQSVRIRFGIATDFSQGAAGWTIDDVVFSGITNLPLRSVVDHGTCTLDRIYRNGFDSMP